VELELIVFLTSTLDGWKIQLQTPAALTLGRELPQSIHCAMERPWCGSERFRKEIRIFHTAENRATIPRLFSATAVLNK